ncbi:MAG TPA: hypothetical protein VF699_05180 [Caulobacteraceae bacterium]
MYTFLFISPNGSIPVFEFAACADAEAAREDALRRLARSPERRAVEVWSDDERLCVVERDSAA